MQESEKKTTGKRLRGRVTSTAMDKTAVVEVTRYAKHKKYGKYMRVSKKYKAHDPGNECKTGEYVTIVECRPISKDTHFAVELPPRAARSKAGEDE